MDNVNIVINKIAYNVKIINALDVMKKIITFCKIVNV